MQNISIRVWIIVGVCLVALQALILFLFGQPWICECGDIKLWEGVVRSSGNSQHISDWYTLSHVIHGFIFYGLLSYFVPRLSIGVRFALAIGVEVAWEILENTPMVINYYRQQALAQGYIGDSIINSVSDTIAMLVGFYVAWKVPVKAAVALAILLELIALYFIRDNLFLNVLGFIYVFPFITEWQMVGSP